MNTFVAQFKKLLRNENIIIPFDFNDFKQKYEYHLQTLIYMINKYNLNKKPKWIEINTYIESLKFIIKENIVKIKGNNYNEQDILDIIKEINYWNVINTSNKSIEELLEDTNDDVLGTRQKSQNEKISNVFGMEYVKNIEKIEKNEIKGNDIVKEIKEDELKLNEQANDIVEEISKILDMYENMNETNIKNKNNIQNNEEINKENINLENNENSDDIITTKNIYSI